MVYASWRAVACPTYVPVDWLMASLKSSLRAAAFRYAPRLTNRYRVWRDKRATFAEPAMTPFGFRFAGSRAMAEGTFENDEVGVFLRYLDKASVCVDIGANIGLYTCLAASRAKHVVAIEPLSRNLALLYKNILTNQFVGVEVFPVGLSSKSGIERIFGSGTGASLVAGWANSLPDSHDFIACSTLDFILNKRFEGEQLLIKMDVEGFELAVLGGALHTLTMIPKPVWVAEVCLNDNFPGGCNDKFYETFEIFWSQGYEARVADAEERIVEERDVARWVQQGRTDFGSFNYIFLYP
jgi:FkbM family methyltransferase